MSTVISRRSFLKCTGVSAAALGAASLLGGCQSNGDDTVVGSRSAIPSAAGTVWACS